MSIGSSGRIVIEIEPEKKRELYAALTKEGISLKEWFLKNVDSYLTEGGQIRLPLFNSHPKISNVSRVTQE
jgi:hypothetical protein